MENPYIATQTGILAANYSFFFLIRFLEPIPIIIRQHNHLKIHFDAAASKYPTRNKSSLNNSTYHCVIGLKKFLQRAAITVSK